MNRQFLRSSLSALALLGLASSANAHHPPRFDRCKLYTIEGDIQRVSWANPHVTLSIKGEDGTSYDLIWRSIQQLSLAGVQKEAVQVGDHVVATGSKRSDDEAPVSILLSEIQETRRGLRWSQPPQGC